MLDLSQYLNKYRNLEPPQASVTRLLISVVHEECGVTLEEEMVTVRNSSVFLVCHPTVRSELRLHAPKILKEMQKKGVRLTKIT